MATAAPSETSDSRRKTLVDTGPRCQKGTMAAAPRFLRDQQMRELDMSRFAIPAFAALAIALSPGLALADGQGAVTGAAGGAVTGAVVGGPVGAAVGGAAGAVIGGAATD